MLDDIDDEGGVLEDHVLLLEVVRSIVRRPELVKIDVARGQKTTFLTISVDQADRGQVIGKDHKTLDALKHLFAKGACLEGTGRSVIVTLEGHEQRKPRLDEERRRDLDPVREYRRPPSSPKNRINI